MNRETSKSSCKLLLIHCNEWSFFCHHFHYHFVRTNDHTLFMLHLVFAGQDFLFHLSSPRSAAAARSLGDSASHQSIVNWSLCVPAPINWAVDLATHSRWSNRSSNWLRLVWSCRVVISFVTWCSEQTFLLVFYSIGLLGTVCLVIARTQVELQLLYLTPLEQWHSPRRVSPLMSHQSHLCSASTRCNMYRGGGRFIFDTLLLRLFILVTSKWVYVLRLAFLNLQIHLAREVIHKLSRRMRVCFPKEYWGHTLVKQENSDSWGLKERGKKASPVKLRAETLFHVLPLFSLLFGRHQSLTRAVFDSHKLYLLLCVSCSMQESTYESDNLCISLNTGKLQTTFLYTSASLPLDTDASIHDPPDWLQVYRVNGEWIIASGTLTRRDDEDDGCETQQILLSLLSILFLFSSLAYTRFYAS